MSDKPAPDFTAPDVTAMAAEALDLWQEHLAALASDPKARQDLAQMMEPSRRLFAEWSEKAQKTFRSSEFGKPRHEEPLETDSTQSGLSNSELRESKSHGAAPFTSPVTPTATDGAAPVRPAADDGSLRLAQLALRVAELEKRIAKLESKPRPVPRRARKTAKPAGDE